MKHHIFQNLCLGISYLFLISLPLVPLGLGFTVLHIMTTSLCNLVLSVSASRSSLLCLKLSQFRIAGSLLENVTSSPYSCCTNHALFDVTAYYCNAFYIFPPYSSRFGFKLSCSSHRPQQLCFCWILCNHRKGLTISLHITSKRTLYEIIILRLFLSSSSSSARALLPRVWVMFTLRIQKFQRFKFQSLLAPSPCC